MPNWMNSGNSGLIWKKQREKRKEKKQVYLVSSSRESGCKILNRVMVVSRNKTTKYTHIAIEKSMLGEEAAWGGSKEEQGRSGLNQRPIKRESGDIWRQGNRNYPDGLALP